MKLKKSEAFIKVAKVIVLAVVFIYEFALIFGLNSQLITFKNVDKIIIASVLGVVAVMFIYIFDMIISILNYKNKRSLEITLLSNGISILVSTFLIYSLLNFIKPEYYLIFLLQILFVCTCIIAVYSFFRYKTKENETTKASEILDLMEMSNNSTLSNVSNVCSIENSFQDLIFEWNLRDGSFFCSEPTAHFSEELFTIFKNVSKGSPNERYEKKVIDSRGCEKWYSLSARTIFDNGYPIRAIGMIKDISEVKKLRKKLLKKEEELIKRLQKDPLTGLLNKIATEEIVDDFLKTPEIYSGKHCFFMIDIDNFKEVNDNLGHFYGDKVIVEISEYLKSIFRHTDIVGRIGGDEFIAFIRNYENIEGIKKKAQEICEMFLNRYSDCEEEYRISASVGICICPDYGKTFEELYRNSDVALYMSKKIGKNTYTFYSEESDEVFA